MSSNPAACQLWAGLLVHVSLIVRRWETSSILRIDLKDCWRQWDGSPWGPRGFKMRIGPPYLQRVVKGDFMGRFLGITVKRLAPCQCRTGTLKNLMKCPWCWEPDRRSNFFSPPTHLCAVTYITEISLLVTLSSQFHYIHFVNGMSAKQQVKIWTLDTYIPSLYMYRWNLAWCENR